MVYNLNISTRTKKSIKGLFRDLFKTGQIWLAVFVVLFLIISAVSSQNRLDQVNRPSFWSYGGPALTDAVSTQNNLGLAFASGQESDLGYWFAQKAFAIGVSSPFSDVMPTRNGLLRYKVQKGDTLSQIAAKFGITLNTLRWANPRIRKSLISPGDDLVILPVSGILYQTKAGDSLEGVAARYKIDPNLIKKYNPNHQELFDTPNQTVILPYAKPINVKRFLAKNKLPSLDNYFQLPARGWNWGELHPNNAVDIAAPCGDPIYAAAEGIVVKSVSNDRWNKGYGNYIIIEHPNGTKTFYSHNLKNLVAAGDYVLQGDKIGLIGNTGNTHGPTGCHVHFEVEGARNPFAVK